jgi:small-conductance mechanosensitive channel
VTVNSITGVVEEMTMRVTVVRDLAGALHVIPNGIIAMVTNRSAVWLRASVDLAVPASLPTATVRTLLTSVLDELNADEHFLALTTAPAWLEGPLDLAGGKTTWRLQCQAHTSDVDAARDRIIATLQQRIPCDPDGAFRWRDAFAKPSEEVNEKPAS